MEYSNNMIIITTPSRKEKHLQLLSNKLLNTKVYTVKEFLKEYLFSYEDNTWYYVSNKYNIIPLVAEYYLDNLYYVNDIDIEDDNYIFLKDLKSLLDNNGYLVKNDMFKAYIANKTIILDGINTNPFYLLLKTIGKELDEPINNRELVVNEVNNITDEVIFVLSEVIKLVKKGISINNIYLTNVTKEYEIILKNYLTIFKIPNNYLKESILSTNVINYFFNGVDNIKDNLNNLKSLIKNSDEQNIYNMLVSVLNNYIGFNSLKEIKELLVRDLKLKSIAPIYQDAINIVDKDYPFSRDDYVFMLSFNEETIPNYQTGHNILSDQVMQKLNLLTTKEINNAIEKNVKKIISNTDNLVISYKLKDSNMVYYPSNLIEEMKFHVVKPTINNDINELVNKIRYVDSRDLYKKYHTINNTLVNLHPNYKDNYQSYSHLYKSINNNVYEKYINHLRLSYSSVNTFYHCSFRYYLHYILKINYEAPKFSASIGTIFHDVLSVYNEPEFDFEKSFKESINKLDLSLSAGELFFLNILKDNLKDLICYLLKQETNTNLLKEYHELNITIPLNKNVDFTGFIDKVKTNSEHSVTAIIDYKTGNPVINLGNVYYGMDMQLPIYLYLIKHHELFKDTKIAGIYLQHILNSNKNYVSGKTLQDQIENNYLLQGYSNEDINIIGEFDTTYLSSRMIKSLSVTNNGEFSHYAKIIDNTMMDSLIKYVEKKITLASEKILKAEFTINPHKVGLNDECANCPFKAVCFKDSLDTVWLDEVKDLDYLKEVC